VIDTKRDREEQNSLKRNREPQNTLEDKNDEVKKRKQEKKEKKEKKKAKKEKKKAKNEAECVPVLAADGVFAVAAPTRYVPAKEVHVEEELTSAPGEAVKGNTVTEQKKKKKKTNKEKKEDCEEEKSVVVGVVKLEKL
jgi:hypothetical protein